MPDMKSLRMAMDKAALAGDAPLLGSLLKTASHAKGPLHLGSVLVRAVENCHLDCSKILAPIADSASLAWCLVEASGRGDLPLVALLAPLSDPLAKEYGALFEAARHGHAECLRFLLTTCEPTLARLLSEFQPLGSASPDADCPLSRVVQALSAAAEAGNLDCVELLLPWVHPLLLTAEPLRLSAFHGHLHCAERLLPLSGFGPDDPAGDALAAAAKRHPHVVAWIQAQACRLALETDIANPARLNARPSSL